jgi:3-oxoadipate enol-lactonase
MPKVRIDDTLEMDYEDDDFSDPWKASDPVVLQPCNAASNKVYYRWVPVIARHHRFIRLNRRGQGGSTVPPPGYPWSLKGFADEMNVFLDRLGLDSVHLIGEATGSYASVQYAVDHPDRVESLTLINCNAGSFADIPKMEEFAVIMREKGVEQWLKETMYSRLNPDEVGREYYEWHAQEKARQTHYVLIEVATFDMTDVDVTDLLPKIKAPTFILAAGRGGDVYPQEGIQRLQSLIPNCKATIIPEAYGYVAHAEPEKSANAWLDFVRNLG